MRFVEMRYEAGEVPFELLCIAFCLYYAGLHTAQTPTPDPAKGGHRASTNHVYPTIAQHISTGSNLLDLTFGNGYSPSNGCCGVISNDSAVLSRDEGAL
jgi:hypothetical protein